MSYDLDQSDDNLVLFDDVVVEYPPGFADADADAVENAKARENLRTRTAANEQGVESLGERAAELESRADSADGERQNQGDAINILQAKSQTQGNRLDSFQTEQTALKGRVSDTEKGQTAQGEAISGLQNEQSSQGDSLESLQLDYTSLSGRVTDTEKGTQANTSAIEQTQSQAQKNADDISATSGRLTDYQASIDSIDLVVPPGNDANAKTRTLLNARATESVQATVEQQGGTLTSHGEDITHLQNQAETADEERQATANSLDSTQTTVTQHGNTLTSHGERLNQLDSEYTDQQDQINSKASQSALDTVESDAESARASLKSTLEAEYQSADSGLQDNIDAANQAALDAAGIANDKGTVYHQDNAPDGDPNGLWIDSGNGNIAKTWDGSQWVVSQDADIQSAADAAATADNKAESAQAAADAAQNTADSKASIQRVNDVESDAESARTSLKNTIQADYNQKFSDASDARDGLQTDISTRATKSALSQAESDAESARASLKDTLQADYNSKIGDANDAADAAQSTADGKNQTFHQKTAPADGSGNNLTPGDLWYDNNDTPHRWDGSSWVDIHDQSIDSKATIQRVNQVESDAESARTSLKTTLQSDYNGQFASVSQDISTKADADTVESLYTLRVEGKTADGHDMLAGFGLGVEGGTSNAIFNVNNFAIGAPGADATYAFVVDGDRVIIDEALIGKLTFSKLVDDAGTFLVQDGKIQAKFLQTNAIQIGYSQVTDGPPADADRTSENTSKSTQSGSATGANNQWSLNEDGTFQIESNSDSDSGRISIDKTGIRGYGSDGSRNYALWNSGVLEIQQADVIETVNIASHAVTFPDFVYDDTERKSLNGGLNYPGETKIIDHTFPTKNGKARLDVCLFYFCNAEADQYTNFHLRVNQDGNDIFDKTLVEIYGDNGGTLNVPLLLSNLIYSNTHIQVFVKGQAPGSFGVTYSSLSYIELRDG